MLIMLQDIGLKTTPEFEQYLANNTINSTSFSKVVQTLGYTKTDIAHKNYGRLEGPTTPHSVKYPRFQKPRPSKRSLKACLAHQLFLIVLVI